MCAMCFKSSGTGLRYRKAGKAFLASVHAAVFAAISGAALFTAAAEEPFRFSAALSGDVLSISAEIASDHYIYADQLIVESGGEFLIVPAGGDKPFSLRDPDNGETKPVYTGNVAFRFRVEPMPTGPLPVIVHYQGCTREMCFMPQTVKFELKSAGEGQVAAVPGAAADVGDDAEWYKLADRFRVVSLGHGYMDRDKFLTFLAACGMEAEPSGDGDKGAALSFILILGTLLGGLALNLTPCVLPMIPVNIAILSAGGDGSRRSGLILGLLYGIGMASAYGLLGMAAVLTGAVFGAINASPAFNLGVSAVFVVLAIAMFGGFNLDFTRFQGSTEPGLHRMGRYAAACGMGAVSAVLAGACVAPVVVSVLIMASSLFAQGRMFGLGLPFVLGIGMALPWPLVGAGLSFLPRPGQWMVWVKRIFGVIILGFAIYYGYIGFSLLRVDTKGNIKQDAGIQGVQWHNSLATALARADSEARPVFIDFWATWCKSCTKMDRTTFKDPKVIQALDRFVAAKIDADAPLSQAIMSHYGARGLPAFVVLEPAGVWQ